MCDVCLMCADLRPGQSFLFSATETIDIKELIDAPTNFSLYNTTKMQMHQMQHEAIYTDNTSSYIDKIYDR